MVKIKVKKVEEELELPAQDIEDMGAGIPNPPKEF